MMNQIFFRILNMSVMAGLLTVVVVLLRLLLRHIPKWIICILWAIVALRLIIPFNIESPLSVMPQSVASGELVQTITSINDDQDISENTAAPYNEYNIQDGSGQIDHVVPQSGESSGHQVIQTQKQSFSSWIKGNLWIIWIAGIAAMLIYALISFIRLKIKLKASIRIEQTDVSRVKIFANDDIVSPFLLGLFKPAIYVPSSLALEDPDDAEKQKELRYVLQHELAHISRGDHIWKPLGFLLLSVNWFNPLIWIGYILLCRDIESACDEKVIRNMDEQTRTQYSETLLALSSPRREISACPVAFGETGAKSRIKAILNYRKPAFWIIIIAIVLCIAAGICLLTVRPGGGNNRHLYELYIMDDHSGSRTPHISLNKDESSFMFNWDQNPEKIYREEGHYKVSGNILTLVVEQQSTSAPETGAVIPSEDIPDRTGSTYVFKILERDLQFLKTRSSEIPLFTDTSGDMQESVPDQAVFNCVDIAGTWLLEDGITILGESNPRNENVYFLFGNLFDGEYAFGCSTSFFSYEGTGTTSYNIFRYKTEDGKIIFAPLSENGSGNSLDSPAPYSFDADGNMSFRQWGEDLAVKPADSVPWKLENAYFYSLGGPYLVDRPLNNAFLPKGSSTWTAKEASAYLGYDYYPSVRFSNDENTGELRFILSYDPLSSYLSEGPVLLTEDHVICKTADNKYTYSFMMQMKDAYGWLVFDADDSTVPDDFLSIIPDGMEFLFTGEVMDLDESDKAIVDGWTLVSDNKPLLSVMAAQRWDYASKEDDTIADVVPVALIGYRMAVLGIPPEDTNMFAYLAFAPKEDEYPAGWRIVILQVGDPMVKMYREFEVVGETATMFTLPPDIVVDSDWVFGLNTAEKTFDIPVSEIILADEAAQKAFDSIKTELPEEMYPIALLASEGSEMKNYQILCATDTSDGNGDIYKVHLMVDQKGVCVLHVENRLDMPAYVRNEPSSELTEAESEESANRNREQGVTQGGVGEKLEKWLTTDENEMLRLMREDGLQQGEDSDDGAFNAVRDLLKIAPDYTSENASELLFSLSQYPEQYGLFSYYWNNNWPMKEIPEEDIEGYIMILFNLTPDEYEKARDSVAAIDNGAYYHDQTYYCILQDDPSVDVNVIFDKATYMENGRWLVEYHIENTIIQEDGSAYPVIRKQVLLEQHQNGVFWTVVSIETIE